MQSITFDYCCAGACAEQHIGERSLRLAAIVLATAQRQLSQASAAFASARAVCAEPPIGRRIVCGGGALLDAPQPSQLAAAVAT